MERLPPELLQQIAWTALNPELFLVCKTIYSRLPPLSQFEADLSLLLLCDRVGPQSAWADVDPFPWQTTEATKSDHILGREERTELQRVILNQPWFTFEKFRQIADRISRLWIDTHFGLANAKYPEDFQEYLENGTLDSHSGFHGLDGRYLQCFGQGEFVVQDPDDPRWPDKGKRVVEILYLPLKLFFPPGPARRRDFFNTIRRFGPKAAYPPNSLVREAVLSAVIHEDDDNEATEDEPQTWFEALFDFALRCCGDVRTLFWDVYTLVIRERKWATLKSICQCLGLPRKFLRSTLGPDINQAIEDNDPGAREFQDWIIREGWGDIQSREYFSLAIVLYDNNEGDSDSDGW